MNTGYVGSKYNRDLDVVAIAKAFRADVKKAQEEGKIDRAIKLAVTTERRGGQSITVTIKTLPEGYCGPYTEEYLRWYKTGAYQREGFYGERLLPEIKALIETVESMLQAYNYDHSDTQSDYFNVRFYKSVYFSSDILNPESYLWMVGGDK